MDYPAPSRRVSMCHCERNEVKSRNLFTTRLVYQIPPLRYGFGRDDGIAQQATRNDLTGDYIMTEADRTVRISDKLDPYLKRGKIYPVGRQASTDAELLKRTNMARRRLGMKPIASLAELAGTHPQKPPDER